ncbi:MAG: M15 family metallopeptidase, partial [Bacteroidales bacterium]|nr:M15 family metallopeptidase [Bacteroidales bacterium]
MARKISHYILYIALLLTPALLSAQHTGSAAVEQELQRVRALAAEIIAQRAQQPPHYDEKAVSKSATDAAGFVVITDFIPDAVVEMRYFSTFNFVGCRVDAYEEPVAICTREAALALKAVAQDLREKGYLIKILDAYRPQPAVDHFVRWAQDTADVKMKAQFYPQIARKTSLFPTYIARRSGHSKGSTIDLTLVDAATMQDVDMGGAFDYFGERSHYAFKGITAQQAANRKVLHDAMLRHGF